MIEISEKPIDTELMLRTVESPRAGAALLFIGTTREWTEGRRTESLDYQCYERMALIKLHELETEARHRWSLVGCSIMHRIGNLKVGEVSVAIAVSASHRREAFEAGQWLIDTLKAEVPIWKRENWIDGGREWIHPNDESGAIAVEQSD